MNNEPNSNKLTGQQKNTFKSNEQKLNELNQIFFAKTKDYLQSELELTLDDYCLLEKMNLKTAQKYSDMKEGLSKLIETLNETNDQQNSLCTYFNQIDHLEKVINELEKKAYQIDFFSKKLETAFKQLDKSTL